MPNPLLNFAQHLLPAQPLRRAGRAIVGLAQDYWKDGGREKAAPDQGQANKPVNVSPENASAPFSKMRKNDAYFGGPELQIPKDIWHAMPGEISERLWGRGCVTPADEAITDMLIMPLGITKDMNVLDLSAGLGWRLRKTADVFGAYVSGLEPDPQIAERGAAISEAMGYGKRITIEAYDPMNFSLQRHYDCIVARETLYRVADKEKFIKSLIAYCKPNTQVSFTDYVVNQEVRGKSAIAAWRALEKGADPVGLVEMAELWAKAGIALRIHDDQTDFYKKEVKKGLAGFAKFMTSGVKPDAETRKSIEKRIMTWAHRMAAIEQGMRFYRFYGVRQ